MYTIQSTRLGFSYQDKYACLRFLQELLAKRLDKIYTDYPYKTQNSVDIRLLLKRSETATEEHIYEIKTGNKFKKDARRKKSSEIKDAISECLEYQLVCPGAEMHICFSKGSYIKTIHYTKNIDLVRQDPRMTADTIQAATWLSNQLSGISAFGSLEDIVKFFGSCQLEELPYPNSETWENLDNDISKHISLLAKDFNTGSSEELPNHYLINTLLHTIQRHTGSGEDVAEFLRDDIAEFFGYRRLVDRYSGIRDKMIAMQAAKEDIKQEIYELYGYGEPGNTPDLPASAITGELKL